ncbi:MULTISPECIES: bifunctional lysylphosphatidylglycerol flippase/synthetase MprF [unclassified Pseudomonas]|uniref:bifunctional lysylphosphatidylglycerol flippase/synthetase MprF n=1 Tax=unclassified Pseudomonas TaxID=196821 RepID=UPI00244C2A11|nr:MULTISPECIES: bifunctional lysylphosphatidylglycerol flippase/synthetase MprF [unclassified Pseudomonas]MDG9930692.1 bifunctional lysylphosphatidylglycerol flippase/synthetase MprF [Pseudomonas sp. GD04042]MDH0485159.1 bifunctional lysylphosphatidylglycerol flippase/synthetase MprF [Pseudomonas sp. GD04015]MDH0606519.1 bifunctional lysylphosphatidylglycerol flippase/synthetase MprF [Pseudomonas sp. GD03869]
MTAPASTPPASQVHPRRLAWFDRISAYRQPIGLALGLGLFVLALVACKHLLDELDPGALRTALLDVPPGALAGALAATLAGFAVLLGYEWSASRYADVRLPAASLALGGFSAFAIGNAVGLSMLSGGSVRYRLYTRLGLGAGEVARMTLFASLSLGCTLPLLAALAMLSDLPDAALALRLPPGVLGAIAGLVLLGYAGAVLLIQRRHLPGQPLAHAMQVRIGRRSLRLPNWRLSGLQLLITALDVCAAATVLYLLLPTAPPFGVFLLVYLLALAAGVLSHVPGGVGVFEAVMLAAFSGQIEAAPLAAALLLYRLIYVVLPLLVACVLLLAVEARRMLAGNQAIRVASGLGAPVLALLVFISGVVLLFSGATPAVDTRLEHLGFLVPHRLIEASHLGASLVGVLCLLLAQGLRRRLSAAWMLTLVLLLVGALLSLLKGFDWEEASLLVLTASLLALFRKSFYRPSRLLELPFSWLYLAAAASVLAASLWLLLFAYRDVPYEHELWWQFALDASAPRALRAALGSALLLAVLALAWLLRAAPPAIAPPDAAELERAAAILRRSDQPDGGLALTGDKALLFHTGDQGDEAFLMYSRRGRSMVALFDPVGPPLQRAELIWRFRDLCDLHHARPVFYQVRAESLPFYMDIGLTAIKLGEEARVDLSRFDLDAKGKEMKDLRYTWNRGQRDGLELHIHPRGEAPLDELRSISDAWLLGKNVREKGFSLGRFDAGYLGHFRIAVVRFQGRAVAFANLLETDSRELASLDLMRSAPDAPKLTMEFLMLGLILHFKGEGYQRFSLGMVPLSGLQPRRGAPLTQRLGSLVFRRGEQLYNFQGLRRFKDKFQPDWEPRYMAVPAGLDPLVALADTAALIAGGLTGLVKR